MANYKVVTLCGSTRFKDEFMKAQKDLTLQGNIVISVGLFDKIGFIIVSTFMSSITSSMISLEGKKINLLKSLPIKPYTIIQSRDSKKSLQPNEKDYSRKIVLTKTLNTNNINDITITTIPIVFLFIVITLLRS